MYSLEGNEQRMSKKIGYYAGAVMQYRAWFLLLLFLNILYGILLWLQDTYTFWRLFPVMVIGSAGIYITAAIACSFRSGERIQKIQEGLLSEDEEKIHLAAELFRGQEREVVCEISHVLSEKNHQIRCQETSIQEYQDYIESWVHEVKTPLALMTFVMDNRQDEMSESVYSRLQYSCTKIQEDVEKMLYYGRLQSECTDYLFEKVDLRRICGEVIEEYQKLAEDKRIHLVNEVTDSCVVTDARGLRFCLRQVVSNAIQYMEDRENRWVRFYVTQDKDAGKITLFVRDNGIGVKLYDRPFIFQKGFTGDKGAVNKSATGMGLYLVSEVSKHLKMQIETPECDEGFEISFIFNL